MIQQVSSRLAAVLGICAICVGATSSSCSFFGRGDSEITVDLATEAPADSGIQQVVAVIAGLEFRKSDGAIETLAFSDGESVDLLDFVSNAVPLRMFTDEQLPDGSYTGVRLLFDEAAADSAHVIDVNGNELTLMLTQGSYADIDFTSEEGENSDESLTLTLDLRRSLSFNDADNEYSLAPVLRSVRTEDAGQIEGTVAVNCPAGGSLAAGGAVYLFAGADIEPDDHDGNGVEPYATSPVTASGAGQPFSYALRFLPEGEYTLAVTCLGNEEDPTADDDLALRNATNLQLDQSETLRHDITG